MKRKLLLILALTAMVASVLGGCSKGGGAESADGVISIDFWAAPNPPQQVFWKEMANKYAAVNPKVKVNVSAIKESPSSEASIQAAIAGGNAPTISENINRGFAAQLSNSKALVALEELPQFKEIIEKRNMAETIKPWEFADGHQYVLPIYSNPMLIGWRTDILKEIGYNEPPKTYSEVLDAAKKLKAKYPDKFMWGKGADLADPTAWKRWFDFFIMYNAASDGNKFIEGSNFVGDEKAGIEMLTFVSDLVKEKAVLTKQATDPFETGLGVFTDIGPWTFDMWKEKYPELKYKENYDLTLPPVPDNMDPADSKTYADAKGLVIFASAPKDKQEAAAEFLKWVYSDSANDVAWFQKTNLPPARDDLMELEEFKNVIAEKPELGPFAEAVSKAVPSIDNPRFNELQTLIGSEAFNKIVRGEIDPQTAWNNMKKAIEGELQQ
ncbi:sugar ABC transporter substrate-binding protein [Paenibacillus sp. 79R4]|uniref:extracellular solute-binding protein n=1 Tax=Paenibacillus sp. 79R4 TaxID=2212847 RepID=UPI0015BB2580|nr:extracellular solute-binding protein [Paenibacillus sp. 79R4]NWL88509.1 sugar ABC transporter substrate-binding protein [Paenibacillus sp. 79R4]